MAGGKRGRLRILQGGRSVVRIGGLSVQVIPSDEACEPDAVLLEEDTWLVLSADPEVKPIAEHPVRLLTELLEAEPLTPGTVAVREGYPLRLLAVVHDLNQDPTCRSPWIASALSEAIRLCEARRLRTLALTALGVRHSCIGLLELVQLVAEAMDAASVSHLQRLILVVPPESTAGVRELFRTRGSGTGSG